MQKQILIAPRHRADINAWEGVLSSENFKSLGAQIILHCGEFGRLRNQHASTVKLVIGSLIYDYSDFNREYRDFSPSFKHQAIIFTTMTEDEYTGRHGVNGATVVGKSQQNMVAVCEMLLGLNLGEEKDLVYLKHKLAQKFHVIRW